MAYGERRFGGGGSGGGRGGFRGGGGRDRDRGDRGDRRDFDMGPKPVKVGEEYDVKIEEVGSKGDGIARVNNFVVFVPGTNKGDNVKIKIKEIRGRFAVGEVVGSGGSSAPAEGSSEEPAEESEDESEESEDESEEPAEEPTEE